MELIRDFGKTWRGVLFALVIAVPAWLLGRQFEVVGGPVFAILLGMVLALLVPAEKGEPLADGIRFTSKKVLQYAVILLDPLYAAIGDYVLLDIVYPKTACNNYY